MKLFVRRKQRGFTPQNAGFTLLEVLLVVAAIAILAGIVIFAVNPGEILAKMRNSQRVADVNKIVNAISQYAIDNNGVLPDQLSQGALPCIERNDREVCKTDPASNACGVDLSALTQNQKYLTTLPIDPQGYAFGTDGSGYIAILNENSRVVVCAPKAELGQTIEVVK
jgi:prepilin-type N-terminal cleavage/methylation domain-containing protein